VAKVLDLDYSGLDGSRLVVGDESGLATLLDGATLRRLGKPVQVGGPIAWLSASPDNRSAFVVIGGRHISDRLDVHSNRWALVDLMAGRVVAARKLLDERPQHRRLRPGREPGGLRQ
jgi:hypothetical protein